MDAERHRTLRATPSVTGPEGSYEVGPWTLRCAVCYDLFDRPALSEPSTKVKSFSTPAGS